jgi:drug efflux transport system permease protein
VRTRRAVARGRVPRRGGAEGSRLMRKVLAVAAKELRQIRRDRRSLLILLFVPAFFLLVYGYALNFDIRNVRLAVEDRDRTAQSRTLVSAFVNSGYFDFAADVTAAGEIERLMNRNQVRAALVIPNGYGRDVLDRRPVDVQILIDGDNANTATTVMGYAQAIVAEVAAAELIAVSGSAAVAGAVPIILEPRVWYNPQLRSTLFLVPGLIAYIAMITAVISTALSVVREKERGTMEQVRMSPVSPAAYVVGKTIPYLVLSFASALLIILVAMALFGMPMRGSWLLLSVAIGLFLIGAQAQGLVISSVAPTQQVAFQLAVLSSFLPTFILSGFIFPISSMPTAIQVISRVIPARYFIVALRAIVLKGADLPAFWTDLGALAIFATAMLALASLRLGRAWNLGD